MIITEGFLEEVGPTLGFEGCVGVFQMARMPIVQFHFWGNSSLVGWGISHHSQIGTDFNNYSSWLGLQSISGTVPLVLDMRQLRP